MKTQYDKNVLIGTSRQGTCSDRCPQIAQPTYSESINPVWRLQLQFEAGISGRWNNSDSLSWHVGVPGLWDSSDAFYYDRLHVSSLQTVDLRIRSLVGLMPLIAVHIISQSQLCHLPRFARQLTKSIDASIQLQVSLSSSLFKRFSLLLTMVIVIVIVIVGLHSAQSQSPQCAK